MSSYVATPRSLLDLVGGERAGAGRFVVARAYGGLTDEVGRRAQAAQPTPGRLPTYFISHVGGPWPWIKAQMPSDMSVLEASLQAMPAEIGVTPKAVLMVSGHWEAPEFARLLRERLRRQHHRIQLPLRHLT